MTSARFRLPDDLAHRLEQHLDEIFRLGVQQHDFASRDEQEAFLSAIYLHSGNKLADIAHGLNNRRPYRRIPSELWCMIWSHLPCFDVLHVARTCHSWRRIALSSNRLWAAFELNINFPTPDCDCGRLLDCRVGFNGPHKGPLDDRASLIRKLGYMALFHDRSGTLPLELYITVEYELPDSMVAPEVADMLRRWAPRLTLLRCNFGSEDALESIFDEVRHFPALHTYRLDWCDYNASNLEASDLLPRNAPHLRTLHICSDSDAVFWDPMCDSFPHVTTLAISIPNAMDDLENIIGDFPGLTKMFLNFAHGPDNDQSARYEPAAARLQRVSDLTFRYEEYWERSILDIAIHLNAVHTLSLDNAVDLSFILMGERKLTVAATDTSGRTRRVSISHGAEFAPEIAIGVWNILGDRTVSTATVSWSLVHQLLGAAPVAWTSNTERIVFQLPSSLTPCLLDGEAATLPTLAKLAFLSFDAKEDAIIVASDVSTVVRALLPPGRRLRKLKLNRVRVLNGASVLHALAEKVVFSRDFAAS
ncbi:hypothetical protein EXIGLDRAFT_842793 [Exidia glandulosa HHB12029]|uniref:F-box domain-containing protein n=1 Tax=Exidia glandulosa HHB12029 TaxID=1314781 RepID=A0A165D2X3_EXIGL|nr:hypothetical protein EXIGLDRAFT_842793 [Exidia glandulosa HHB12029]